MFTVENVADIYVNGLCFHPSNIFHKRKARKFLGVKLNTHLAERPGIGH